MQGQGQGLEQVLVQEWEQVEEHRRLERVSVRGWVEVVGQELVKVPVQEQELVGAMARDSVLELGPAGAVEKAAVQGLAEEREEECSCNISYPQLRKNLRRSKRSKLRNQTVKKAKIRVDEYFVIINKSVNIRQCK